MGGAPEDLTHRLGMTGDANDTGGIHSYLRFQYRRNLKKVVGGGVEEQKADRCSTPDQRSDPGLILQVPEPQPVVAVFQEISDHHNGGGDAHRRKEQSPGSLANFFCSPSSQ